MTVRISRLYSDSRNTAVRPSFALSVCSCLLRARSLSLLILTFLYTWRCISQVLAMETSPCLFAALPAGGPLCPSHRSSLQAAVPMGRVPSSASSSIQALDLYFRCVLERGILTERCDEILPCMKEVTVKESKKDNFQAW